MTLIDRRYLWAATLAAALCAGLSYYAGHRAAQGAPVEIPPEIVCPPSMQADDGDWFDPARHYHLPDGGCAGCGCDPERCER